MPQRQLSSSDALARDIVRGLYEGRFSAGQRLVEPDLMARYAVSRSTVREAIKKLTAQGIAESHLNRGARIRELTRTDAENILLIIEQLIGLAARQAAEHIDAPGNRALFQEVYTPLLAPPQDLGRFEYARLRNRFHRTMARIGGNRELADILSSMNAHMLGHKLDVPRAERQASYQRIITAILNKDSETAETQARAHVRRSKDMLDSIFPKS
ncbi:GntR family transcriptional regulator [Thalassobius sp. S69A]|uniref:GntR family transcriptional regulator n=1 Tax=unclassified Thalassovita TaxID=2619711 RepID=UPI000C121790|nr:hypothetical protein [Paracoccaceae bacterium]MBT26615.1 hypothetical protein [Paracoccaceae bacterium]